MNKGNCFQVVADSFSPGSVDGKSGKMEKNGKIGENGEKWEKRGNWGKIGEIERTFQAILAFCHQKSHCQGLFNWIVYYSKIRYFCFFLLYTSGLNFIHLININRILGK